MSPFAKRMFQISHDKTKNDTSLPNSNYLRCKYVTALISMLELFMLVMYCLKYDKFLEQFRDIFLFLYIFLFAFSAAIFCTLHFNPKLANKSRTINALVIVFVEVCLLWGAVITLLDQFLYAQIIVFVTNLMFCCTAFLIRPKTFIKIILPPVALVFIGLPYLNPSDPLLIGNYINLVILIFASIMSNYLQYSMFEAQNKQKNEIKMISEYDGLTNLYNRRTLNKFAEDYKIKGKKGSLGVLMIDIDYFKKYNDYYGHIAGDLAIVEVANILNIFAAQYNGFAARYGGEEFVLIFEDISDDSIHFISETICKK